MFVSKTQGEAMSIVDSRLRGTVALRLEDFPVFVS